MRVFVTGGTGFVGRRAVAELDNEGVRLLILSRRPRAAGAGQAQFLRGDLARPESWRAALKKFRPDAALHLAWEGIPDYAAETSIRNMQYGLALYRVLAETGCRRVVTAGSCWEYGNRQGRAGEMLPPDPQNAFAKAKVALHWLGGEIAGEAGMEFLWARLFYVYGPGQKATSLIPYLCAAAADGKTPVIKNPKGGNDFVHVSDVARALGDLTTWSKPVASGVYNIGSGRLTSIIQIVRTLAPETRPKPPVRAEGFYADIGRIKKAVLWRPRVSIEAGLREYMNFVKQGTQP